MANTDKNLDQYFKERLANHEEKPSRLAWERLESQLPKKDKGIWFPLMGIAATLLLFLTVGYVVWQTNMVSETGLTPTSELTASNEEAGSEILVKADTTTPDQMEEPLSGTEAQEKADSKPVNAPINKPAQKKQKITEAPKELLAEVSLSEQRPEEVTFEAPEIMIPPLDVTEAIAQNNIEPEQEVISYKITIKSNGIKEEPEKQGLISGIENKVDKIGGLLNKVEQGFADLQDAKDNLFVSNNTSRKERK